MKYNSAILCIECRRRSKLFSQNVMSIVAYLSESIDCRLAAEAKYPKIHGLKFDTKRRYVHITE